MSLLLAVSKFGRPLSCQSLQNVPLLPFERIAKPKCHFWLNGFQLALLIAIAGYDEAVVKNKAYPIWYSLMPLGKYNQPFVPVAGEGGFSVLGYKCIVGS